MLGGDMNGYMGGAQMLRAKEMMDLEAGEAAMHAEMGEFEKHCTGSDATLESCESYRGAHLDTMSTMLDNHDDMCGQMMEGMGGGPDLITQI